MSGPFKMKGFSGFKSPLKQTRLRRPTRPLPKPQIREKEKHWKMILEMERRKKKEKKNKTNPKSEKERYLDYLRHTPIVYPKNIA